MLSTIVVDDDIRIRDLLIKVLKQVPQVELVGQASSGQEAVELMTKVKAKAIFMDIDMPGISGIEAGKRILDEFPKTHIVFVTAHENFMPDAFEMYAFDYIVKPFKIDRVKETVSRMIGAQKDNQQDRILLKNQSAITLLTPAEIIFIGREQRTTIIHTKKGAYKSSESLTELEEKLTGENFIRAHKSYLINTDEIAGFEPYGRWTYVVTFNNCKEDALITKEKFDMIIRSYSLQLK